MPEELENTASSLKIEESNAIQREPLLAFILNEFEKLYNSDASVLIAEWKKYCNHMNKKISFYKGTNQIEGYFIDIDKAKYPLGKRYAYPNEIADLINYLLSSKSSFITGQTIIIDGGFTLTK